MSSADSLGPLEAADVMALQSKDFSPLEARLKKLQHSVTCSISGINFHLHYPSFRQGAATVPELVRVIVEFITAFALPRSRIKVLHDSYGVVSPHNYEIASNRLKREAVALFKKAHEATNRSGESGELLLYLFCEWVLEAPQLLAKMQLKTDSQMPVHGSDGVHVRYEDETDTLLIYWGESKLYANVSDAISRAVASIAEALKPSEIEYEFDLVSRNIDLSGLSPKAKAAILRYLDPFEDEYDHRRDIVTCMIGYDCECYNSIGAIKTSEREKAFLELVKTQLGTLAPKVAAAFTKAGIADHSVELFFLPLPSVDVLRVLFQEEIGWGS